MKRLMAIALVLAPSAAMAQQASCPLTLPEGALQVERPPTGWRARTGTMHLASAGMLSGAPEQEAYLVPLTSSPRKSGAADAWVFTAGSEKWLWCSYGGETIRLFQRMDDAATRCDLVSKEKRTGVYLEMKLHCKP